MDTRSSLQRTEVGAGVVACGGGKRGGGREENGDSEIEHAFFFCEFAWNSRGTSSLVGESELLFCCSLMSAVVVWSWISQPDLG